VALPELVASISAPYGFWNASAALKPGGVSFMQRRFSTFGGAAL